MEDIMHKMSMFGVVPVAVLENAEDAVPLARAMKAGGIPCVEVTLRTEAGLNSIAAIAGMDENVLVGAGSVMDLTQCRDALAAGARFIVSPGFDREIVEHCLERGVAVLPGCVTPSEIMAAMELGIHTVKFFPANVYGGLAGMKALSGPFPKVKFIPTGGVNAANLGEYLAAPFVAAVGGSWLCAKADIATGRFDKITELCREARQIVLGYELGHIGMNALDINDADVICGQLKEFFGLPIKEGGESNFAGTAFEIMKEPALGTHGHIAIRTNSIQRALADLEAKGWKADPATVKYKEGRVNAVYLENEIGGFAIHLLRK